MSEKEERISNQSMDLGEFNKERLLEMFPIFRTEGGGVDFDRLKLALGESVEVGKEVFGMRWPGKADSIRLANAPSHGTLSPDEKESVNFDTTQNLIIEGDNLEVLKLLQKSYQGKVKMVYIDPPYNTGNDFVYEDDFADGIKNYLQQTGQIDDEGNRLSTNSETDGRFHSNWMNMMLPRLYLAKNLMREDGVIFVSIDDHEIVHLMKLMDEVFGAEDRLGLITVVSNWKGRSDAHGVASANEFLIAFAKSSFESYGMEVSEEIRATYRFFDEEKKQSFRLLPLRKSGTNSKRADRPNMFYPLYVDQETRKVSVTKFAKGIEVYPLFPDGREGRWRWGIETAREKSDLLQAVSISGRGWDVHAKDYLGGEGEERRTAVKSVWIDPKFSSDAGTYQIKELFESGVFDFPKPLGIVEQMLSMSTIGKDEIILDFFAGSGTTAHAVMAQNAKDGGNRKFILIQLPEQVDPETEAAKAGFHNIADITKERVRRAGKKIIEESDGKLKLKGEDAPDFGFRVLKLNESNIEDWDSEEASKSPKDLLDALKTTRLKSGRSEQDVVFEVLVKFGIELTSTVEEQKLGKGSFWKIAGGELMVVVSPGLSNTDLNSIAKMAPKVVVMLDEAFVPESLKTNARAIFKDAKIELKTF